MQDLRTLKRKTADVDVPDLGCTVRLRQLGAVAFAATQAKLPADPTNEEVTRFNVELLAQMIVNENGEAYLDDQAGRDVLTNISLPAMLVLGEAAADLNGTSAEKKS